MKMSCHHHLRYTVRHTKYNLLNGLSYTRNNLCISYSLAATHFCRFISSTFWMMFFPILAASAKCSANCWKSSMIAFTSPVLSLSIEMRLRMSSVFTCFLLCLIHFYYLHNFLVKRSPFRHIRNEGTIHHHIFVG